MQIPSEGRETLPVVMSNLGVVGGRGVLSSGVEKNMKWETKELGRTLGLEKARGFVSGRSRSQW